MVTISQFNQLYFDKTITPIEHTKKLIQEKKENGNVC